MRCLLCLSKLEVYPYPIHTNYACVSEFCLNDDMPRYQETYNNYPTYLISRVFMFDPYYIIINYRDNNTIISRLEGCILFDTVQLPRALEFNLKNPYNLVSKIKTLMVFS